VKKIYVFAITLMLTTVVIPRQLTEGPGPMPICSPDNPQGCVIGDNPLLP
jgi:hypothetical protein